MIPTELLTRPLDIAAHSPLSVMTAGGGGPVDLDITFPIYLVIFLLCWALLKVLIFDPWVKVRDAREQGTVGNREEANEMRGLADTKLGEYQRALSDARAAAAQLRAELKAEGERSETSIVGDARGTASGELTVHREAIQGQLDAARGELNAEAQRLGSLMADTLLPQ
jgi:F-type H+-transporting ATPase subunit b